MERQLQNRVTYIIYCINAFAERYQLSSKQAFAYLKRFQGMAFLDECYEAEHQLSIQDAVTFRLSVNEMEEDLGNETLSWL